MAVMKLRRVPRIASQTSPVTPSIMLLIGTVVAACSTTGTASSAGPSARIPGQSAGAPDSSALASASALDSDALPPGRTVTLADDGATFTLAMGDRLLLRLGTEYDWTVSPADPSIIDRVRNVSVIVGAQGVYEAGAAGRTTLTAIGDPPCRKSTPACGQPSRLFRIEVVVR